MEQPPKWPAAECRALAEALEQRAQKATAAWAREQCLFSAGLFRILAEETEAREMPARNQAAD
jgi:hypothetical protein